MSRMMGAEGITRYLQYLGEAREAAVAASDPIDNRHAAPNALLPGGASASDLADHLDRFFEKTMPAAWKVERPWSFPDLPETPIERPQARLGLPEGSTVIGLTGKRGCGKSMIANLMMEAGYVSLHPFNPGKEILKGYYAQLGIDEDTAKRMLYGDLKDAVSPRLAEGCPKSDNPFDPQPTSRWIMEQLGRYMGVEMGPEWTIGSEVHHHVARGADRFVMESIAYEADFFGRDRIALVEIVAEKSGRPGAVGLHTDLAVAALSPDFVFHNRMGGMNALREDWTAMMSLIDASRVPQPARSRRDDRGPGF